MLCLLTNGGMLMVIHVPVVVCVLCAAQLLSKILYHPHFPHEMFTAVTGTSSTAKGPPLHSYIWHAFTPCLLYVELCSDAGSTSCISISPFLPGVFILIENVRADRNVQVKALVSGEET